MNQQEHLWHVAREPATSLITENRQELRCLSHLTVVRDTKQWFAYSKASFMIRLLYFPIAQMLHTPDRIGL